MASKINAKALLIVAAFVLIGAGCSGQVAKDKAEDSVKVESGATASEQADIVVDEALDSLLEEANVLEEGNSDADLFDSEANELNNLENSYDESQL